MPNTRRPDRPRTTRTPTTHAPRGTAARPSTRTRTGFGAQVSKQAAAGRMFVPSALTILAICAGLTAIRMAGDNKIDLAMMLVVAAAVLDGLDGRVARMMGATSRMGAEIDSLADAINFGVVPAMLVYVSLMPGERTGWVLILIYCCAIVLRLARFNTLLDDDDAPGYTRDFFVGVPAPAAALSALLPIAVWQQFGTGWWTSWPVVGGWLLFIALLAVSRVPTASLKATSVPPRALAGGLTLVAIGAALLVTFPYILMMVLVVAYLAHIPFAWRNQRWVASRPEHWDTRPAERRAERKAIARAQPRRMARGGSGRSQARLGLRRPTGEPRTEPTEEPPRP
ncbi:phosphatidylcholine/phosphatidylserine synthase [Gordonia sp. CPCC 205515]|uniref:CDP-alcohol phosphatidyltransferase family protein n=1 Tax=Gordonia sp. CPCC 205515 TaxID=3140791 RepID=UPI003AF33AE5